MRSPAATAPAFLLALALMPARADEGMWTTNNFPAEKVQETYGFRPDQAWLEHVRLSSLRLARGCSASFVSARGLVQTNHHCAHACIEQLSSAGNDLVAAGFYAKEAKDERKCPDIEADQLIAIDDVTDRVKRAIADKAGREFSDAKKAIEASIAKECTGGDENIRCDVVELYHGGLYNLYRYRRYQDVRLVFAPELAIAFFGGDPDNFEFPRYDLDVSYLRVYVDDAPLDTTANYLRYAKTDAQAGDLTFTSGHPGGTNRLDTVAQLEFRRDVTLPRELFYNSELRGLLTEFATKGPEQARIASGLLFGVENSLKARKGQFAALVDPAIIRSRAAAERDLRARVDADPGLHAQAGAAWDNIRTTLDQYRAMRDRHVFTEGGEGFRSRLYSMAKALVRHAAEASKPDEARLPEFTAANFPFLRQSVSSAAPIYPELEKLTLTFSLTKLREALGPDDEFVRTVLGDKSPAALASELIDGTGLADVDMRKRLLAADQAAIDASTDPMIVFVRRIDPQLRAVRKAYEDDIQARMTRYTGQIADATFRIYGTSTYPDATFTLRVSYGTVAGYREDGKEVDPITRIGGAFTRATGADPFKLPDSWLMAKPTLDLMRPFNLATTNDIVGGNSGSPVINRAGEVVGLIFDGNIQSLGGSYGYDPAVNRAVAVAVGALREALSKIYHADRIVDELSR
jgi:peptidase S46-like protein